jgi:group I intron endonuclease
MSTRKELIKEYKQTLPKMGVYMIKNTVNGKMLIGSVTGVEGRLNRYRFQLNNGSHPVSELQKDFKELGEAKFSFEVIDILEPKDEPGYDYTMDLASLENLWLEKLQPYDEKGYNKRK